MKLTWCITERIFEIWIFNDIFFSYNLPSFHNDIGLIRLKEEIEFADNIQPIEYEWREVPIDSEIKLTGWGRVKDGSIPNNLQEIQLTHISYEECKKSHGKDVDVGHLCTFNKVGEGSCNGDSWVN